MFWFWTPWCPACQGEAPKLAKANPDITFIDKYDTGSFTNIADVDGAVWQRFGVTAQPAFAFVGREGSVDVVRGPLPGSELAAQVADLKS